MKVSINSSKKYRDMLKERFLGGKWNDIQQKVFMEVVFGGKNKGEVGDLVSVMKFILKHETTL